jgi:hypothetical protein
MSISGGDFVLIRHATLVNIGTLVLTGPVNIDQVGTWPASITNDGTIIRNGAGSSILSDGINFEGNGVLRVDQGTMQIGSGTVVPSMGGLKVADAAKLVLAQHGVALATSISLTGSAQLDLGDHDLILDYSGGSPLAAVQQMIRSARAGGAWGGNGITSSAARDCPQHNRTLGAMEATDFRSIYGEDASFDDVAIDNTAVLVKFTYYGDADFNGRINFDDYSRTDIGFNNHMTGWRNGDFDGDGRINFDDYVLIDLAFNTQSATPGRA